ncbi:undecaprenyldiphospho-muramoylpentapeptide beta-N-acetylglucosaminyltransferase [Robiginitomaculum antarcticum]|uniref:undecaprenyldiphospho-muramoylpentapeptide beta-N-acetylglucosaminyltransferase n=1 Tax=Robiginitomaculum antarcticum TaxID=437507 RepID=UPI00037E7964|nr:undecaprenyldiphospho-muramoylpentapeptide beta-N-acetylglucosaminyltransferase [Robiginitomaculum antarcticum]
MRALLAAGGTGGHMFPAQALAETLKAQGWDIAMMTDTRGEKHAGRIPADPIIRVSAATLSPRLPHKVPGGILKLLRGVGQAKRFIKSWKPDVVIGFGGYPAFPAIRAAQALGIPTILHEQNAVLGRVNRVFAAKAEYVACGFDCLLRAPAKAKIRPIGNPMRDAVLSASKRPYTPPGKTGPINLLIVGGSLGSTIISTTVPKAISALPESLRARLHIVQQTRAADLDEATKLYKAAGVDARCAPFFADIQTYLAKAHFIIARAGASSVSEIALMGLPSLLVPLAIAMDDHQTENAKALKNLGCADLLPESEFTPETVKNILLDKLCDSTYLETASRAALNAARPDATARLADLVKAVVGAPS